MSRGDTMSIYGLYHFNNKLFDRMVFPDRFTDNEKNTVVLENAISINPLNWKRDDTYAPASENLGDRTQVIDSEGNEGFIVNKPGLADAQIDLERGVVVSGKTPEKM